MDQHDKANHPPQKQAFAAALRRGRWTTRALLGLLIAAAAAGYLLLRVQRADHNSPPTPPAATATGSASSTAPAVTTQEKAANSSEAASPQAAAAGAAAAKQGGNATPVAANTKKDRSTEAFRPLKGRWLRPDGGYVLEVKGVNADGKVEVMYLNPNPIHVSEAKAAREDAKIKLFVELRDAHYPGCTYSLTYDPQHDLLQGVYFQAEMQEKFDVVFERIP